MSRVGLALTVCARKLGSLQDKGATRDAAQLPSKQKPHTRGTLKRMPRLISAQSPCLIIALLVFAFLVS